MREHARPEAVPEHLRPYLLPLPETKWEVLFLLRCFSDLYLERRRQREHAFLRPGGTDRKRGAGRVGPHSSRLMAAASSSVGIEGRRSLANVSVLLTRCEPVSLRRFEPLRSRCTL